MKTKINILLAIISVISTSSIAICSNENIKVKKIRIFSTEGINFYRVNGPGPSKYKSYMASEGSILKIDTKLGVMTIPFKISDKKGDEKDIIFMGQEFINLLRSAPETIYPFYITRKSDYSDAPQEIAKEVFIDKKSDLFLGIPNYITYTYFEDGSVKKNFSEPFNISRDGGKDFFVINTRTSKRLIAIRLIEKKVVKVCDITDIPFPLKIEIYPWLFDRFLLIGGYIIDTENCNGRPLEGRLIKDVGYVKNIYPNKSEKMAIIRYYSNSKRDIGFPMGYPMPFGEPYYVQDNLAIVTKEGDIKPVFKSKIIDPKSRKVGIEVLGWDDNDGFYFNANNKYWKIEIKNGR